ncbi:MAG: peptidylprolyl isomerase [Bacteroidota bacterium]|nr:peptidylprolyl isomerase [Bacteroidota bacterium]
MGIMTRMRNNMPVILIGLVIVFIITIVFEWGMDYLGMSRQSDTVGTIEGKKISYQQFSELIRDQTEQYKKQSKKEPDENLMRQIREQVWNNLVTQSLLERETKRAGITVTDQEIIDWVRGENPPEFLVQQFRDSTGTFRRDAYDNALNDPKNREVWLQVETALRQQRLAEKMQSVVFASVRATDGEVRDRYIDQNLKANIQYAFFDPDKFVADNAVTVSDDDIKKVYNQNTEEFKQPATRKLKYVFFNDQASAKDSAEIKVEVSSILQRIKSGFDFLEVQKDYSETSLQPAFFKHGELTPEKESAIFSAKIGDVVGPIADYEGEHLFKILEEKKSTETFVKARHILLSASTPDQEVSAKKLANELIARAKRGEDFSALARQYSTEPAAATSGGDLGWFGKGRMVKEFESAALAGRPGQIIGPVKTQFGIHVIKIEGRDNRELKVAAISLPIKASSSTKEEAFQRAQDFAYIAKKGNFETDAEGSGLKVQETSEFNKGTFIPGLGQFESLNKFAFKNGVGDISDAYQVNNGYAVVKIAEVKKEGIRPFDEVKESLRPRTLRQKKMEQLQQTVQQKYSSLGENGDLNVLTSDINISVQTTGDFSFGGAIPGVGRENAVSGAAKNEAIQKILSPIEGKRGYYLVKILNRTSLDTTAYSASKNMIATQLINEKKQRVLTQWLEKMKETAEIEDNRDSFFR